MAKVEEYLPKCISELVSSYISDVELYDKNKTFILIRKIDKFIIFSNIMNKSYCLIL